MESQFPAQLIEEQRAVEVAICSAFRGVTRSGGVSWSEARVVHAYGSPGSQRLAREKDIDQSWEELLDDPKWQEEPGMGGFSFLDSIGFRYYIPAAMIRCSRSGDGEFTAYALTISNIGDKLSSYQLDQVSRLNHDQAKAIARFLRLMIAVLQVMGDSVYRDVWIAAYNSHWRGFDDPEFRHTVPDQS